MSCDCAVRNPRCLLHVDYVRVAIDPRDDLAGNARIVKLRRTRRQFIGAVLRFSDRPASDHASFAIGYIRPNEFLVELGIAARGGHGKREAGAQKAQPQIHGAPRHLFDQHVQSEPMQSHSADLYGKARDVVAQLV